MSYRLELHVNLIRSLRISLPALLFLFFSNCVQSTDGYTSDYFLPAPSASGISSSNSGITTSTVISSWTPATTPAGGCAVDDGTNYFGYWNGLEGPGGGCAGANFKARLQERLKYPHKVIHYTNHSYPQPVGYSSLPSGFTDPPANESSRKTGSNNYLTLTTDSAWVVQRFNVWDFVTAIALKGVNPGNTVNTYSAAGACAADKVYDPYGGNCMTPPGQSTFPRLFNTDTSLKNSEGSISSCSAACQAITYNREHTWPKSWFAAGTTAVNNSGAGSYCYNGNNDSSYDSTKNWDYRAFTDLHHLRPTSQKVNSIRSNNPFGVVTGGTSYSAEPTSPFTSAASPSSGGKSGAPNHSTITAGSFALCGTASGQVPCTATTVFEPPDHIKGNIARIYFYMATRYFTEDTCWATSDGTDKATLKPWYETMMRAWHTSDPVDAQEVAMNDLIHRIQGNRNPFVDHPEWVAQISDF